MVIEKGRGVIKMDDRELATRLTKIESAVDETRDILKQLLQAQEEEEEVREDEEKQEEEKRVKPKREK